ncbi:hypothetical protein COB21_00880 [Candidatus Aerophobetes bacterium]|uniref:Uncharacterized protein n=1 Tax=Aerophobetes bacterium TaxID=2030807 RepID=A0A2A4X711_UNCAE|nr:MAG: hypothetical protein COB21_00880 [Candidatus Aerophobetes bacterium]
MWQPRYFIFLIALFIALLAQPPCCAENARITVQVPLYLNKTFVSDINLLVSNDYQEKFVFKSIANALRHKLTQNGLDILDQISDSRSELPPQFSYSDFSFNYNTEEQILYVTIPFRYISRLESSLKPKQIFVNIDPSSIYYPSPLSGIIDFAIDSRLYHFYYDQAPSFSDLNIGSNFSINLKDTLLDGYVYLLNYTGGDVKSIAQRINRGNLTLTRDFTKSNVRFKLGDISPSSFSFQNTLPMLGLNFLNSPNLFKNSSYSTANQHEFMLNSPSRVDIYINNTFIRTLNLPAGPHLVKDFPFANGVNNVNLKITDAMGNVNELNLESLFVPLKVAPGQFAFDASFGFPKFQEATQRFKYLFNRPTFSAIFGVGVSNHISAQCYAQAIREGSYLGSSVLVYNKFVETSFDLGSSFTKHIPPGIRSRLSISSPKFGKTTPFSWACNLDFTSPYFSYLGTKSMINREKWMFSTSLGGRLPGNIGSSLTGYYGLRRKAFADVWSLQYTLNKSFKHGGASIVTSYKQLDNRKKVFEMVFNFNLTPHPKTRLSSNYNTRSKTSSTQTSYSHKFSPQDNLYLSAGLATAKNRKNFTGKALYQGPRGSVSANHYLVESAILPLSDQPKVSGTTHINGRTALFFADNSWCIGKPIHSSFAIIKPQDKAKNYPLYIDATSKSQYLVKSSLKMGSVIPLASYQQTSIQVDSFDAPPGFRFDHSLYTAQTTNRSGVVIPVCLTSFMYAQGYFIDQQENPITYSSGYIIKENSPTAEKIFFFTNKFGKFALENLEVGSYTIYFDQFKHEKSLITIKDNENVINLGKIVINLTN